MHDTECSERVAGYLLAGGRSTRMGTDKALLEIDGEPRLEAALGRLQAVCSEVNILSGPRNDERDAVLSCYGRLVPDVEQGYAGPLAGLAAALGNCQADYALLLALDQPAVTVEALRQLIIDAISSAAAAASI